MTASLSPGGDVSGSGDVPVDGVNRLGPVRWERDFGVDLVGPPAVAGDWVLVGDAAGRLHALAAGDGRTRWTAEFGRVSAPPAVADGTVYVGTGDERVVACELETGRVRWHTDPLRTLSPYESRSAVRFPVVVGDLLLCRTWEAICALERGSGRLRWYTDGYTNGDYHSLVVVSGLAVHATAIASTDGCCSHLDAVDVASGEDGWGYDADDAAAWDLPGIGRVVRQVMPVRPAVVDDRLYAFESIEPDPLDEDRHSRVGELSVPAGEPVCWLAEIAAATGERVRSIALPPGLASSCEAAAVRDGVLWCTASEMNAVLRGDPTGAVLCRIDLSTGRADVVADLDTGPFGAPVIVGGMLYQATTGGLLHAVDTATGRERWRLSAGLTIDKIPNGSGQPSTVDDGVVFARTRTGLAALGHEVGADSG